MELLTKILHIIRYWIAGRNYVRSIGLGSIEISPCADVAKTKIYVYSGASLIIDDNCIIKDCVISVTKGSCRIGENTIIEGVDISIDNGEIKVGHHCKISCKRIWVRFGGIIGIGDYTNINSGSEIRCDESVSIGSYNQISYNVRIWDTNTHSKLSKEQRRYVTESHFPYFGFEETRPETAPVIVGDDCWIGEGVVILKGSTIGDRSIIGFGTFICGRNIPSDCRAVNERKLQISPL